MVSNGKSSQVRLSVVIVNYLSYEETIEYAKNLLKQKGISLSVVIVDNDSPNNSLKVLSDFANLRKNIHVIDSGKNGGYSYGNNVGIKYVIQNDLSEYVIVSNNDIDIETNCFLLHLVMKFNRLPEDKAFVSPIMYDENGKSRVAARKLPTLTSEIIHSSLILDKFFGNKADYRIIESCKYQKVDCVPGAFFMGKTGVFEEIGFFDEHTFLYGEERILGYKVKKKGYSNYLINELKFYHEQSKTINNVFNKLGQLKLRNKNKIYYWKEYKNVNLAKLLIVKLFLKISEFEFFLLGVLKNKL